ncbi:MAG: TonB-dependent receptor [Gemmatimonadota bacterium]|nr:TonB-dependent receptor [Gemmatimonadota bacterium]
MNRGSWSINGLLTARLARLLTLAGFLCLALPFSSAIAQQTGTVSGRVTDDLGNPLSGVQVYIASLGKGTQTRANGDYALGGVPGGTYVIQARLIGFRPQTASVSLSAGSRASQNFVVTRDPLELSGVVVTGNLAPRPNLESSVAVTTLSPKIIETANSRSTTEMLRLVPGFTRVESSGGEVNQNITMRGILGVEYVMFMEDGLPVFPTMHTYFMNADNLFRPDENIERLEVVRGGSSALFGSNTPGAIANFINKTGGDVVSGTMKTSAATQGLARYDFNVNGPLNEDWKFNLGGFYRYDHGVRNPGFPGIRGGQVKASVTRQFGTGYVRASVKMINDHNQFILPLPFQNPLDPVYAPGFGNYGSMNTNEANHVRVPIPGRELELPLDDGIATNAQWITLDAAFDVGDGWRVRNSAQTMRDAQSWNALLPFNVLPAATWIAAQGLPAGSVNQLFFTNVFTDANGTIKAPFNTANGLVAEGGLWHVEKPLTHFQDQLTLSRSFSNLFAPTTLSGGLYFGTYTQGNHWYFTNILTDVRDNPHFLDLTSTVGGVTTDVTKNGFRNFLSYYQNGAGQATIVSGVVGTSIQFTPRFRTDLGYRSEWNNFVQTAERVGAVDLDNNPATKYNNETYGLGTFTHFSRSLNDWAASLGFNFLLTPNTSLYASGSKGYKMPPLDDFLQPGSAGQVALFEPKKTNSVEGGVKYAEGSLGLTVNGFLTQLKNITGQGAVVDPVTGQVVWAITTSPEQKSYGAEFEATASPVSPLLLLTSWTFLRAKFTTGAINGLLIDGVPNAIGNFMATWKLAPLGLTADWHYVASRVTGSDPGNADPALRAGKTLPTYNYFNFGASAPMNNGMEFRLDVLNAFQSRGLEEGNPRLASTSTTFLARPLLPRRIMASLRYDF